MRRAFVLGIAFTLFASVMGWPREARAGDGETRELRHDLRVDIPATAGLAVVTVGFRLVRDDLEPSHCRICDGSRTGDGQVNAVDDWFRIALRHPDPHPANVASYVLAFGAAPVGAVVFTLLAAREEGRASSNALVDILVIAQGGLSAMMVTQVLEAVTLRTRPYVHAMENDDERAAEIAKTGAFHSFPAGHVVEAFGVAAAAGTVASMRNYRLAPLVWTCGMIFGAATAYMRVAADRHYFTDVLAGGGIGTLVGAAVPLLFHSPVLERATIVATAVPGGQVIGVGGSF